ncbi:ergothioneine biosynthesis glutamate--cysteine ligase EgtA [Aldersonia sp. NBC_00410]|uniref:ergothioneine biosynthesis glutamate--cysteine ligase EgtA n=1 Tax=Aldersonia sp. NBC_00410 TaxID=2975954 RepID=UPI00225940B8|nr:ergothioneine biosynthesis glutamate--cysteine ligase EgtA [Aldersonia sp. NBC_00410]MCX5045524.1 ergothioneine biosynthesis glutamate--cysteine ligase EgtA [Aldersonia sp. NBC_00410]
MATKMPAGTLSTRAAAEAFVGGVCFKLGPPALIGAELEWLTTVDDGDCPTSQSPPAHVQRPDLTILAAALGPYAPTSISPSSPARPLPNGGLVTVEPGGQLEISSSPAASVDELCGRLRADEQFLRTLLRPHSIGLVSAAADEYRPAQRLLQLPRYCAMENRFLQIGPFGKLMMCNTAATQVSVDAGVDLAEAGARWRTLDAIGPALLAAFACSPVLHGIPPGSWASQRMRTWLHLDRGRTAPPIDALDPAGAYVRWAVTAPLLCIRRDGSTDWTPPRDATFADWLAGHLDDLVDRRPDWADLDYHLTTLFPPVRATGHLEVRYIDAQPGNTWTVPIHAIAALTSGPKPLAEAAAIAAATASRWVDAARSGLADSEIRTAAVDLLRLAEAHAPTLEAAAQLSRAARRCRNGRNPIEEAAA